MRPQDGVTEVVPWVAEGEPFLDLRSHWMRLVGEHLRDDQGRRLEHWRIEKADSVIVLPILGRELLLPARQWRPGVSAATLDFPGGRVAPGATPADAGRQALQRELGLPANAITGLSALNTQGWAVNSSFSDQRLFGMHATLTPIPTWSLKPGVRRVPVESAAIETLLDELSCLQCRVVLLEWWRQQAG